ncbi:MAG: hypothetical protein Q8M92_10265, partial [Candidatus Subteraquimicrobiales bacterium]|nr:hypothetical protein [Candidatus Subteraquimicrobiales bacterium]
GGDMALVSALEDVSALTPLEMGLQGIVVSLTSKTNSIKIRPFLHLQAILYNLDLLILVVYAHH